MKSEPEIYYDPKMQVLWEDEWIVPIEELGVERNNDYENKRI